MKNKIRKIRDRRKRSKEIRKAVESGATPRITNETVAEAREDVLHGARKIVYPLSHSKHRVLITSTIIILTAIIAFLTYMLLNLYRYKNSSDFTYRVTQVLPFPIAKVGSTFVPYENYLFEVRRYVHYYNHVETIDFNNPVYKPQLDDQKQKILGKVVNMAYIKRIAIEKGIVVTDEEVDNRIDLLKKQNRLGNNDQVFSDTLRDFYNWSESDFRRSIHGDILASKVVASIDGEARTKANSALDELKAGADFAAVVAKYSDDASTKSTGGELPGYLDPRSRSTTAEEVEALSKIKVGETTGLINTGDGFEILKLLEEKEGTYKVSRIVISFKDIDQLLNDYKARDKATVYIKL